MERFISSDPNSFGSVTGKLVALVALINVFLLVTGAYPAVFKQLALLVTVTLAVLRSEIIQHLFEIRIFLKDGITPKGFKTFCKTDWFAAKRVSAALCRIRCQNRNALTRHFGSGRPSDQLFKDLISGPVIKDRQCGYPHQHIEILNIIAKEIQNQTVYPDTL